MSLDDNKLGNVISSYDNSKGQHAGYSFYIDSGEIGFFNYIDRKFSKVPFNVKMNITMGNITLENNKYLEMIKNMMEYYCTYIENGKDIVTEELQTLKLYRINELFITHNVFTSITYVSSNCIPKPFINISNYIAESLKLRTLKLFNTNYYIHFYVNEDAKRLSIIETKIYFWWYYLSRDKKFNENGFFAFYLWVFNNLNNINEPTVFGNNKKRMEPFNKYFEVIERTNRLTDLFVLRYGPKYLTDEELQNTPIKIYNYFDFNKCKTNLKSYILSFGKGK